MDDLLEAGSHRPLTIVVAGPGWGKTTTVAGWARRHRAERGTPTAWLTLGVSDDSAMAFWHSVLRSIMDSGAVPDGHPLSRISVVGGMTDGVRRAMFSGLSSLPRSLLLVLDDFHTISDAAIMSDLTDLVSFQTQVHVLLLTRYDPPLPLHRLRTSGALAEIRAGDLAFDEAAVHSLAIGAEALDLSPGEIDEILERTEGWPTGVRLATMHLSRTGSGGSLDGFGGSDRSVAEYLAAEVLERNAPEVREFLLRTSVVEMITGSLADAIVPDGSGGARLDALERSNQFVTSVDPGRTLFRYHPLLRDMLLHSLLRDDPEGFRAAHRAAAGWLVAHGEPISALGHAVAAEDWPHAAGLFVEASPSLVGAGSSTVRRHLQAIPFDTLPPSPAVELCQAGLEYLSGHFDAMEAHVTRTRHLLEAGGELSPLAMALLENLACAAARARGDEECVAAAAEAALHHVSQAHAGRAAAGLRSIALTQRAVALLRAGRTTDARGTLATVVREESPGDVGRAVLGARGHLAWCDLVDGDLIRANRAARAVVEEASARGWASQLQVRFAYLPLAITEMLWGNFEEADRVTAAGLGADANGVEVWPTVALRLTQSAIAVSRSRPRAAVGALVAAHEAMPAWAPSPSLAGLVIRTEADVALLTDGVHAERPGMDDHAPSSLSARARLSLHRDDLDEARDAATGALRLADTDHLDGVLAAIDSLLVLALVADRRGRSQGARAAIGQAVELAAGQRIVRPFLTTGSDRVAALMDGVPVTAPNADLLGVMRRRLGSGASRESAVPEPEPLIEPLTERELAVLAELPTMRTNDEIATTFFVSVNTVKSHLKHLYRKLGVTNRREAVRRSRELGLIP